MGAIAPAKKPKVIKRTDNPDDVASYAKGDWIKGAVKKPGALRAQLGTKAGEKIPANKLAAAAKAASPVSGRLARRSLLPNATRSPAAGIAAPRLKRRSR
jgi:hypothetical protein